MVSEIENKVLKKLYKIYKTSGIRYCWKAVDAIRELGISNGTYLGMLHSSKYIDISVENTHECFKITDEGIRLMNNQKTNFEKFYNKIKNNIQKIFIGVVVILTINFLSELLEKYEDKMFKDDFKFYLFIIAAVLFMAIAYILFSNTPTPFNSWIENNLSKKTYFVLGILFFVLLYLTLYFYD